MTSGDRPNRNRAHACATTAIEDQSHGPLTATSAGEVITPDRIDGGSHRSSAIVPAQKISRASQGKFKPV
jgi:hypothetical protein